MHISGISYSHLAFHFPDTVLTLRSLMRLQQPVSEVYQSPLQYSSCFWLEVMIIKATFVLQCDCKKLLKHHKTQLQSTLPKSNLLGLKKKLRLRENSSYEGKKTKENRGMGPSIDLRLRRLFDLYDFDLGRVDCISMFIRWIYIIILITQICYQFLIFTGILLSQLWEVIRRIHI